MCVLWLGEKRTHYERLLIRLFALDNLSVKREKNTKKL